MAVIRKNISVDPALDKRVERFEKTEYCQGYSEATRRLLLTSLRIWEESRGLPETVEC